MEPYSAQTDSGNDLELGLFVEKRKKCRRLIIKTVIVITSLFLLVLVFTFVVVPIIFKYSLWLQRLVMFTNVNLPRERSYFENFDEPAKFNFYVPVQDTASNTEIFLGAWHLLPYYSYNGSVVNDTISNISRHTTIIYFHGAGEARSYCTNTYDVLRFFFHVIPFDYRDYADSSNAELFEDLVVNDAIQVYKWLKAHNFTDIFVWGHSLGSALATRMVSELKKENQFPVGLVLESAFTSMRDEIPVHKYGKIFAWLPWFTSTILDPLEQNGFVFNTSKHILNVDSPVMLLHAEDDSIVPYSLGKKLFHEATSHRNSTQGVVIFHGFDAKLSYDHFFINEDPRLPDYVFTFIQTAFKYWNLL